MDKLWSIKDDKKCLDISKVTSDFRIVSKDGLTLVCPKKNMFDWEEDQRWLRSTVIDANGFVVSCGWPKFGNYNEFSEDTATLNKALENIDEEILYTHKEDGSLCIRSVINGKVIFRTRGTLFGGEKDDEDEYATEPYGERFLRVAQRYPKLLDPSFMDGSSLLFEYVSPDNCVVVRYNKEDLIFIGAIRHCNLHIYHWNELEQIAKENGFNLVRVYQFPNDIGAIIKEIEQWEKDEGIVVRFNNCKSMLKIKSLRYCFLHRLKSNIIYRYIAELAMDHSITEEKSLSDELTKSGLDFETITSALELFREYVKYKNEFYSYHQEANKMLAIRDISLLGDDNEVSVRKYFAGVVCKKHPLVRSLSFALYDGKEDVVTKLERKYILLKGKRK